MEPDVIEQIEAHRSEVVKTFAELFAATVRFPQGEKLLWRFSEAVDQALAGSRLAQ
jgi:hypothetical protein